MKKGIKILLVADGFMSFSLGMLGPIYAIFVEKIGGDILDASWAYSTYMITAGVVMYILSKWEDRSKHKEKFIVMGYALTAVGCLLYVFVTSQTTLLIAQIILGLAIAVLDPAFDAIYAHFVTQKEEASNWGIWESTNYIITAIAAIAGGYIAKVFGFQVLFVCMFLTALMGVGYSLFLFKSQKYLQSTKT